MRETEQRMELVLDFLEVQAFTLPLSDATAIIGTFTSLASHLIGVAVDCKTLMLGHHSAYGGSAGCPADPPLVRISSCFAGTLCMLHNMKLEETPSSHWKDAYISLFGQQWPSVPHWQA